MNRATDGDIVVVEVFPENEWKASADEVVDQDGVSFLMMHSTAVLQCVCSDLEER